MNRKNALQSFIDQTCGVFSPTSLKTQFSLKNFRVFDNKQGATFNLTPITILTGCNSSGKSSVVKAILLLRDFFEQLRTQNIADCKLDFGNKLAKLGKFDNARNYNSRKGSKMTFTYTVRPKEMKKDLRVQLTFAADKDDTLNNGYLSNILITKDGSNETILDLGRNDKYKDCYDIKLIDLNSICGAFIKSQLKKLTLATAHNTASTGQIVNEKGIFSDFSDEVLEPLYELLNILGNYLDQDEFNDHYNEVKKCLGLIDEYGPDTTTANIVRRQIIDIRKKMLFFNLPLFDWVDHVPKSDVRRIIYEKIYAKESDKKKFHHKEYLDAILNAFEKSAHNTLTDYFREQEDAGLVFKDIEGTFWGGPRWIQWSGGTDGLSKVTSIADAIAYDPYFGGADTEDIRFSTMLNTFVEVCKFVIPTFWKDEMIEDKIIDSGPIEEYKLLVQLRKFYNDIILQALNPIYFRNFEYIGDSAINIQRLYSSERDDEFGKLLLRYLDACRQNEWRDINAGDFINKWVKKFGLGDYISISQTAEGLGLVVKLHMSADDKQGRLLADEGFGITKLIGTMINIETSILSAKRNNRSTPMPVGTKRRYSKISRALATVAIEEPENHLHPRYQALLAEMFVDAYKNYNIHFIVETHSEYMVRKLQTLVAKKELTQDEVSLQYVYDADPEKRPKGEPHVKSIEIREDGTLRDAFGPGFFDEADNLAMDLLTIKAMG